MYGFQDGKDINTHLKTLKPDLIMLDVLLKGTDGRGLCHEIRTVDKTTPIILMSANPKYLEDYEECGASDVIEKPFEISSVLKKIKALLENPQQCRDINSLSQPPPNFYNLE